MSSIQMSTKVDAAIRQMCVENMTKLVTTLSEKYKFDATEAMEFLELDDASLKSKAKTDKKTKTDKNEKKEKKEVDPSKPKKTSGYLLYSADVRPAVKAELTIDGEAPKPQAVVSAIGAKWKALSSEEQEVWNEKAKAKVGGDSDDN